MSYLNGFYYRKPKAGSSYIFINAADLWRGCNSAEGGYDSYLFPSFFSGTIEKVEEETFERVEEKRVYYNLTIKKKNGEILEDVHTQFVILSENEISRFLKEMKSAILGQMEREIVHRRKKYNEYAKKLKRKI